MKGIWLRYGLVWPGLPPQGNPEEADGILVQAFGRNKIREYELSAIGSQREKLGSDAATLGWLRRFWRFEAGGPNLELARRTQEVVAHYRIPAIVQWEVAFAMDPKWLAYWDDHIHCLWPPVPLPPEGFTTWRVKQDSVRLMATLGIRRPIELAHRRQIVRAALIVRKLTGKMPITLGGEPDGFDPRSVQPWTTGKLTWLRRESLVRAHHILHRYVI